MRSDRPKRVQKPRFDIQGAKHPKAFLTEQQVRQIRALRGKQTQKSIAAEFGVAQMTICNIQLRRSWNRLV
jgi:transcriptional regulator